MGEVRGPNRESSRSDLGGESRGVGRVHGRQGELEDASRGRMCVGVGAARRETEELVMSGKGTIHDDE